MPTIEFRTFNKESYANTRPVAAREYLPEWWKQSKIRVDHRGRHVQTIRSCPSMQDWLTMGTDQEKMTWQKYLVIPCQKR